MLTRKGQSSITACSRRQLLTAATGMGAFLGLRQVLGAAAGDTAAIPLPGFGALRPDPARLLDLPAGFSYRVISRAGDTMHDGLRVPAAHDGMGAFDGGDGRVILICNHELQYGDGAAGPFAGGGRHPAPARCYDDAGGDPCAGGTTTLIYDPASGRVENHFLSLAGTERNCAGGITPWGSWLTCEESVTMPDGKRTRSHGWVFEVPAAARELVDPAPLTALGRFNHEAVAVDPVTGVVYLTEDTPDSLLYRFLPSEPGRLRAGGRLQALSLPELKSGDTRNWGDAPERIESGRALVARWIDLDGTDAPDDDLRKRGRATGAALFARGEGICHGDDAIYFACTSGGRIRAGQIFRYRPSAAEGRAEEAARPGMLELFVESGDRRQLENCDNVVMAPWGDLIVCEDAKAPCALVGVTGAGRLYLLAQNSWSDSELAGACFAPDGRTLFVNLQSPGLTLAIQGPFPA